MPANVRKKTRIFSYSPYLCGRNGICRPFHQNRTVMNKLIPLWTFVRQHKYLITLLLFAVIIVFVDENSVMHRLKYYREEIRLREEIEKYRAEYEASTELLNELEADSGAIERVAREKYLMKKPNEDIYVFEED